MAAARTSPSAGAGTGAGATGSQSPSPTTDGQRVLVQTHPRYDQWRADWLGLGYVYEGDGPYLDGSALVPHSRELIYAKDLTGKVDFTSVIGQQRKFLQRKTLAHYQNFASVIVDTLVDHQYAKTPTRDIAERGVLGHHPLQRFWEDVDGLGTHIDDYLEFAQTLAHVYGHCFILMDRQENVERAAEGRAPRVRTRASDSRPVLRTYIPVDAPDWLAPAGRLTAIKFIESVERTTLTQPSAAVAQQAVVWDDRAWTRISNNGKRIVSQPHGFGRVPVVTFYARRRARIPVIGRSTLRDYRMYRDHYNMLSELREIFRAQTFSMLHIQLKEGETVEQARAHIGDHAGTDSLLFSMGGAEFIAPPEGPAAQYAAAISELEQKIFRLVGIQNEGSGSLASVAADTMRIRSLDLNRMLAHFADQAEIADREIARLWFAAEYGPDRAAAMQDEADLVISHSDEFFTEQITQVVQDAAATIAIGVGPTATALIKRSVVNVALKDVSAEQYATIVEEIEERAERDADMADMIAEAAMQTGKVTEPDPNGKGQDPNNDPAVAGRSSDPRAGIAQPANAPASTARTAPARQKGNLAQPAGNPLVARRRAHRRMR
jgi:hypothetical protein